MYEDVPIKKKKDIRKDDTLPADFDLYNLNYLEESELNPKQIVSGYTVRNKVEDYEIGEFKRLLAHLLRRMLSMSSTLGILILSIFNLRAFSSPSNFLISLLVRIDNEIPFLPALAVRPLL